MARQSKEPPETVEQVLREENLASVEVLEEFTDAARDAPGAAEQRRIDRAEESGAVLSGGDVDAVANDDTGEETVGGENPTPDQDRVDELGRSVGVSYADGEPLHTTEKVEARDAHRWELDPASDEGYAERERQLRDRERDEKKPQ